MCVWTLRDSIAPASQQVTRLDLRLVFVFFVSCALVSLSLSVTGERDEKLSENKEDAVQPN